MIESAKRLSDELALGREHDVTVVNSRKPDIQVTPGASALRKILPVEIVAMTEHHGVEPFAKFRFRETALFFSKPVEVIAPPGFR